MPAPESAAPPSAEEIDRPAPNDRFETAVAFCTAAAAAYKVGDAPDRRATAEEHLAIAAAALVELAHLDALGALRVALRPDPEIEQALWTVACYQVGDLIPCDLDDFNDPVQAVRALAACEDPSHVAAELIASTGTGVRWTALVRVGERIRFQLAGEETASSGSGAEAGALERALEHWNARLEHWGRHRGTTALGLSRHVEAATSSKDHSSSGEVLASLQELRAAMARQEQRLEVIEARLASVVGVLRSALRPRNPESLQADPVTAPGADEQ